MKNKLLLLCIIGAINLGQTQCFDQIYPANRATFALKTDGTLWSWGINRQGVLGTGNPQSASILYPYQELVSSVDWVKLNHSTQTCFGIKADGTLWAWGSNGFSSLGSGTSQINMPYSLLPIQIGTDSWLDVSCTGSYTLGVKSDGTLWGWGRNADSQLALPTGQPYPVPTQIGTLNTWAKVYTLWSTSFAIKNDGTLWSWGSPYTYQLGYQATLVTSQIPHQIGTATNWKELSVASTRYKMGIKTDGTLWAWGNNPSQFYNGHYGNGFPDTNDYENGPVQVGTANNWEAIAATDESAIAIKTDGTLWAWGYNFLGQLGIGSTEPWVATPVQIGNLTNWVKVKSMSTGPSVSTIKTFAINSDGFAYQWGITYDELVTIISAYDVPVLFEELCTLNNMEITTNDSVVFPNPFSNVLNVLSNGNQIEHVIVYNNLGQIVFEFEVSKNLNEIINLNLDFLSSGHYILNLIQKESVSKYLIQKK